MPVTRAELLVELEKVQAENKELRKHLGYVCMIAERLGPKASEVHREEALYMLDGTISEARSLLSKA